VSSLQQEFDSPLIGCSLCYRALERGEAVYEEQIGWAKQRAKGGLNALVARRSTGRVACERCVQKARRGIHPDQLTIA
jgi:hypothetical protein